MNNIHCKTVTLYFLGNLMDVNCSTSVYSKPCHLLIVVTCHPVTPHISNHCLTFVINKRTTFPAILNIENLRETVSQIYSLSQAIILSCLPSRNYLTNVFEDTSWSLQIWQSCFPRSFIWLCHACSLNVLKVFQIFYSIFRTCWFY